MNLLLLYLLVLLPDGLRACNRNSTSRRSHLHEEDSSPNPDTTSTTELPIGEIEVTDRTRVKASTSDADCTLSSCKESAKFPVKTYLHVIVSGLPFQRGESHGRQAKDKILSSISYYKTSSTMPPWDDCVEFVRTHFMKSVEYYFPNALEEMKGIAHGAGVTLEDILILNARHELRLWKSESMHNTHTVGRKGIPLTDKEECKKRYPIKDRTKTTNSSDYSEILGETRLPEEESIGAVALAESTQYGHVLIGHNWSSNEAVLKNETLILLEVHPDPCERIQSLVMLTEAGQLGKSGMNGDGLGIVGMNTWSSADDKFQADGESTGGNGWVPATLLQRMFLEAPNFSLGLTTLLTTPKRISVNMIIATGENEAFYMELRRDENVITPVPLEKQFLANSNHFKSTIAGPDNAVAIGSRISSALRGLRVERHLRTGWPRINEYTFQLAFRDHVGHPNSVCEHSVPNDLVWTSLAPKQTTVASIIFNLSQRTLQMCRGPPCICSYKEYRFKFSQL